MPEEHFFHEPAQIHPSKTLSSKNEADDSLSYSKGQKKVKDMSQKEPNHSKK